MQRQTWHSQGRIAALLALAALAATPGAGLARKARSQPSKPDPKTPAAPAPTSTPTPAQPAPPAPNIQRLVFSPYVYSYQADTRRRIPVLGVRNPDGSSALAVHPWDGTGPWFSYDRTQWHKSQLPQIRAAGVDVLLPVYQGDAGARATYALKGLDCLAQAMKELRREREQSYSRGKEFPLVGMYFDTSSVGTQLGTMPDLKRAEDRRTFYGMIREFFLHVPPEFRALAPLPPERARTQQLLPGSQLGAGVAHIVFLSAPLRNLDAMVLQECSERFAREFGAPLLWIGGSAFQGKADGLDGVTGTKSGAGGWITVQHLSPGRDESAVKTAVANLPPPEGEAAVTLTADADRTPSTDNGTPTIESRRLGRTYIEGWIERLRSYPDWMVIDSWNASSQGTDIAPTHEFGTQFADLSRAGTHQFKGGVDYGVHFVSHTVPAVMAPRAIYQVQVTAQNVGLKGWTGGIGLSYRWFKDGQPVGDPAGVVMAAYTAPNDLRSFSMGVTAPMARGKPLPEGDYELRLDMMQGPGAWFESPSSLPYVIPVRVTGEVASAGNGEAPRPYWITSGMPSLAKAGVTYTVPIRLRNDGAHPWRKAEGCAIGYRWRRVSCDLKGLSTQREEPLEATGKVVLPVDVLPGTPIVLDVPVRLTDDAGKPLPVWSPKEAWSYQLEWDLYDGKRWASEAGAPTRREAVAVLADDLGPNFLGSGIATTQPSGNTVQVKVGVRNDGSEPWSATTDRLVYHWYFFDGSEARWAGVETKLPNDVKPGETVVVPDVRIQVPDFTGPMYLTVDFKRGQNYASTGSNSRGGDLLVLPVNLVGGAMAPLNLGALFDTDGISFDTNRGDGDLDGKGHSLPGEGLPPYVWKPAAGQARQDAAVYPCGLWTSPVNQGDRVPFWYPEKKDGGKNMLTCAGQRMEVPPDIRSAVHLLGTATEAGASGEVTLIYRDGTTSKVMLEMSSWTEGPQHGEHTAFTCLHRHSATADEPGVRTYLYHYILRPQRGKYLAAVELPNNPAMKVVALTLEKDTRTEPLPTLRLPGLLTPK